MNDLVLYMDKNKSYEDNFEMLIDTYSKHMNNIDPFFKAAELTLVKSLIAMYILSKDKIQNVTSFEEFLSQVNSIHTDHPAYKWFTQFNSLNPRIKRTVELGFVSTLYKIKSSFCEDDLLR